MMLTLGTLADAGDARAVIDVTAVEAGGPDITYSARIRRADAVVIAAAEDLTANGDGQVEYVFQAEDLAAPGALWLTLRAKAADGSWREWTFLGWVVNAAYDGGYGAAGPLWAEALMAMLYASNGTYEIGAGSGKIAITVIPITLAPEDWSNGAAVVTNSAITAASVGWVRQRSGTGADQYALYAASGIFVADQEDSTITLQATGTVPEDDLELEILLYD
jgi:hypothetical protein